ncbi:uncharacterized protein LOC123023552 [Varanus komodoensis]|uniref:uncharacterized protein LOC123023552 n=1 Tax=Varanus komodoensis TaxID=61221 RepID=UPI001CF7C0BD|nr:uncharacterized protein LOC123023552 [Varanus komodoensis]
MLHQKEKEAEETPGGRWCNNDRGFRDSWFTACLQETLLPGKPWHKVLERLEAALAEEVKHQISDLKEREMVFHLLGQSFVERHLNDCPIRPTSLFPDLNTFRSIGLEDNARAWLRNRCFKAAERMNCQFHFEGDAAELTPEMARFLDDAYNVVAAEMELLLAGSAVRHKVTGALFCSADHLATNTCYLPPGSRCCDKWEVCGRDGLLYHEKSSKSLVPFADFQWHIRPELHPPVLSCPESNLLGNMLCDIISQGSENMSIVCERLSGKLLPWMLRQFLWNDKLLRTGFENHTTQGQISVAAREAREKFEQTVAQRVAERKLRSAARSPLSGLIENAVVEDFLAELILQEKGSAPGIGASESEPDLSITQLLLTSPVLFLRKWMWEVSR